MKKRFFSIIPVVLMVIGLTNCKKSDYQTIQLLNSTADRYEGIILEILHRKRLQLANSIIPHIAFEYSAQHPRFEHIGLILQKHIPFMDKENQAVLIEVRKNNETIFKPFMAAWKAEGKINVAVREKAVLPETIVNLKKHNVDFTIGGGTDNAVVRVLFYYSTEHLTEDFQNIRSTFPKQNLAPQPSGTR